MSAQESHALAPSSDPPPAVLRLVRPRGYHAIPVDFAARVNVPMSMAVRMIDISMGGARFAQELHCTPGVPIAFGLDVPGLGSVPITAVVVWVNEHGTGVRFTGMTGERAEVLWEALLIQELNYRREQLAAYEMPAASC